MNNDQLQEKIVEVSKKIFSYCMAKTRNGEEVEEDTDIYLLCRELTLLSEKYLLLNPDKF